MAVFSVASFTCASTSISRASLLSSKPCQLQACEGNHIQPVRTQRSVVASAASQHDSELSQTRARASGKARAVAKPSVLANLAEEPPFIQGSLRGESDSENGSPRFGETEAEDTEPEEDEDGVELSEDADEDGAISPAALQREVSRRRNFAIISHPDAGKTTLVLEP